MKTLVFAFLTLVLLTAPAFATVVVTSPYNLETVGPWVHFVATASTATCSRGVASMGVYVNNNLLYVANGAGLDKWLPVSPGWNHAVVQEWDYCGGSTAAAMDLQLVSAQNGVNVTSPSANSTVSSPVSYVATATTGCSQGVASMGVYVNNQLVYVQQGGNLNHQIPLNAGNQHTVVQEWDYCGGSASKTVDLNVNAQSLGKTLWSLQSSGGWNAWREFPPNYSICQGYCPGIDYLQNFNIGSPSLSGHATQFSTWGTYPYADVLWSLPLLGQNSTQGVPDTGHTLLPTLHHFKYDADFYVSNLAVTQVLEFDISMYMNGAGMVWGTQCNHLGGGNWDIYDNQRVKWVPTSSPCNMRQGWNHVTLDMERSADNNNWLLYKSITLNGVTMAINAWFPPFSVPSGWWGVTINYQMDGDSKQSPNTTYVDNLSFNYY